MADLRHAVVIGGSIAGLCAGRVLADHFERVTVFDRDRFPTELQHRKGVPQSRHPHALLDGGRRELERLFPGFERLCQDRGALELDPGFDLAVMRPTGWTPRRRSPFTLLFASRVLFESVIRELAARQSNLEVIEDREVSGLRVEPGPNRRVTGVILGSPRGENEELAADLVVDASGRATRVPGWLEKLGLPPVEMTVVDADAGYSSRWYQAPSPDARPESWWWKCLWIEPLVDEATRLEEEYFGVLFPIENDRWIVTTASWGGRELATDAESFERIVSKLRTPVLAEAIARAKPISPVYTRRGMQNSWRHYERWRAELPGFVATGDAVCGFNPVYGQGMTSAARCAVVLRGCLEKEDPRSAAFSRRFLREQADFLEIPWMMAVSRDRQQARLEADDPGTQTRLQAIVRRGGALYLRNVAWAAGADDVVNGALFEVVNLTRSPTDLFRDPFLVARVLWARLRQILSPRVDRGSIPPRPPADIID